MFEYESCYVGNLINYHGNIFYVFSDNENELGLYKVSFNDNEKFGLYEDNIKYSFDFDNPIIISKHHSLFDVHKYHCGLTLDQIADLQLKILSGNSSYTPYKKEQDVYELGQVLSIKKFNHKVICICQIKGEVYYAEIRNNIVLNNIKKTKLSKINKVYGKLSDKEIEELIADVNTSIRCSDILYEDDFVNEVNKYLKK